jgi:chemotaxis protein histidine kinase CheA
MTPSEAFRAFLDQQKLDFKLSLPAKLKHMEALWGLVEANTSPVESLIELERMAHSMGGSCGTFGFPALGTHARQLESLIETVRAQDLAVSEALRSEILGIFTALRDGVHAA